MPSFKDFLDHLSQRGLRRLRERSGRIGRLLEVIERKPADHGKTLANLETDAEITDRLRLRCLLWLCSREPTGLAEFRDRFRDFCFGHQRLGRPVAGSDRLTFGHVQSRRRFEKRVADDPDVVYLDDEADSVVEGLLRLPLAKQRERLQPTFRFADHQMFSTYDPDREAEPFRRVGTRRSELRRRLGLADLGANEALVLFSHRLPRGRRARVPTVFDGELLSNFRPGGSTVPLAGDDGLPEAVHRPVAAVALRSPIRPAD